MEKAPDEPLPHLELHAAPKKENCLAWSDDGDLAVAAGESVHVFIPNRACFSARQQQQKEGERGAGGAGEAAAALDVLPPRNQTPWHHVHFAVSAFTRAEWPDAEMQGMRSFGIGREQAPAEVIALAWSPAGLADGGRCALAVLTSNSLLSVWGPALDAADPANWRRRWVVTAEEMKGKAWERTKEGGGWGVVAMAWAPAVDTLRLPPRGEAARGVHFSTRPLYMSHYLALITERGETVVFHVAYDFASSDFVLRSRLCASDASFGLGPALESKPESEDAGGVLREQVPVEELRKFSHLPQTSSFHGLSWSDWDYDSAEGKATASVLWKFYDKFKVLQVGYEPTDVAGGEITIITRIDRRRIEGQEDTEMDWAATSTPNMREEASKRARRRLQQIRARPKTWNQPFSQSPSIVFSMLST